MDSYIHKIVEVETIGSVLVYFPFCLLTLFVLVYYILRRYRLYREIKRIPRELLRKESYKNHLKNLKIKCIIHNFIIVILILECIRSIAATIYLIPEWVNYAEDNNIVMSNFQRNVDNYSYFLIYPILCSFVPVLCLLMNFLWLAYRKYEYKYTIIWWTWYIGIRLFLNILNNYIHIYFIQYILYIITSVIIEFFIILDFIQFVYYSKRFYVYLKSREKEILLFYYDNKAYRDIKYTRLHFKIATIFVGIALFFYTVGLSIMLFEIPLFIIQFLDHNPGYFTVPLWFHIEVHSVISFIQFCICKPARVISSIIFTLDYLYIFIAVVYKSYRDRQRLANINSYIRPIVMRYQDRFYNRYNANYA